MFVNGVRTASGPIVGTPDRVANRLLIGGHNTEGLPKQETWDGIIYNAEIWNVAKTDAEINASMYQKLSGTETNLVACWLLDEGSENTANDLTGKHNGSIVGSAKWVMMPY